MTDENLLPTDEVKDGQDGESITIVLPAPEHCEVCGCVTAVEPAVAESDTGFRFVHGGKTTNLLCFTCYREGIMYAASVAHVKVGHFPDRLMSEITNVGPGGELVARNETANPPCEDESPAHSGGSF